MEKKIQDYWHLYVNSVDCVLMEYNNTYATEYGWYDDTEYQFTCSKLKVFYEDGFYNVKLLLRPLSSMTEEEKTVINGEWGNPTSEALTDALAEHNEHYVKKVFECFELMRHLLSRGFDLFDLIPSGLAIDKTLPSQQ